jgi:MFS family permease
MSTVRTRWYQELNSYHWFVLLVAALGWLFDCLDQQLFNLARVPAMRELLARSSGGVELSNEQLQQAVDFYGPLATSIFLIGWATGGLFFGVLGDRIGRAKTMVWTILLYSAFTGLSAISFGFWDFACYRFLTGLGVGGEFAVGVALVAEVMPNRARPFALGLLQALSAIGNVSAGLISIGLGALERRGTFEDWSWNGQPFHAWRIMFVIGIIPALLAVVIRRRLREPERWQAVADEQGTERKLGSYRELFSNPRWAKNAVVGLLLASSGIIGLWAIAFFSTDLIQSVFRQTFEAQGMPKELISAELKTWTGIAFIMLNVGAFFGMGAFTYVTHFLGRRPTFAIFFVAAMLSTAAVFKFLDSYSEIFWMLPLMGFCQLALFGGYAIYFPELFPTYLRSTGTSFCYNVGRYVAATGPLALGLLTTKVYAGPDALRSAGVTMCSVFLVGLLVLPFAPETQGQPLPE